VVEIGWLADAGYHGEEEREGDIPGMAMKWEKRTES
jgi:hypothetical protein